MNCPECGARTRVKNSRTVDTGSSDRRNAALTAWADEAVGWYTQDWVARTRVCFACGWASRTVEILNSDWVAMAQILTQGGDNERESRPQGPQGDGSDG